MLREDGRHAHQGTVAGGVGQPGQAACPRPGPIEGRELGQHKALEGGRTLQPDPLLREEAVEGLPVRCHRGLPWWAKMRRQGSRAWVRVYRRIDGRVRQFFASRPARPVEVGYGDRANCGNIIHRALGSVKALIGGAGGSWATAGRSALPPPGSTPGDRAGKLRSMRAGISACGQRQRGHFDAPGPWAVQCPYTAHL